jgi:hypothetical protein
MIRKVMPGKAKLVLVRSGCDMIFQVISCEARLGQVLSGHVRLGLVSSKYDRLGQDRSGFVRLGHKI